MSIRFLAPLPANGAPAAFWAVSIFHMIDHVLVYLKKPLDFGFPGVRTDTACRRLEEDRLDGYAVEIL